jgi:hypothetical protein
VSKADRFKHNSFHAHLFAMLGFNLAPYAWPEKIKQQHRCMYVSYLKMLQSVQWVVAAQRGEFNFEQGGRSCKTHFLG